MKLTPEEQTSLFNNEFSLQTAQGGPPFTQQQPGGQPVKRREDIDDADNLSVSSGAKYRGNVTLEPSGPLPSQQQQQPPRLPPQHQFSTSSQPLQSTSSLIYPNQPAPQAAPMRSTTPVNGYDSQQFPPSNSRGLPMPAGPGPSQFPPAYDNIPPFSPVPAGSRPLAPGDLNYGNSPPRIPVPQGGTYPMAMPQNGALSSSAGAGSNTQSLARFLSNSNAGPSNPLVPVPRPQPLPSTSGGGGNFPPTESNPPPTLSRANASSNLLVPTPMNNQSNDSPQQLPSSSSFYRQPSIAPPSVTNVDDQQPSPTTIPPPNLGNNKIRMDMIRRSFSRESGDNDIPGISTGSPKLSRSNDNNAPTTGKSLQPEAVSKPAPLEKIPSVAAIAVPPAAPVVSEEPPKSAAADDAKANKVKALAQRFAAIKASASAEPSNNQESKPPVLNRVRSESNNSNGNADAPPPPPPANTNNSTAAAPAPPAPAGNKIAIPSIFNKQANANSDAPPPGKIQIPSLKRPNLFRAPIPVPPPEGEGAAPAAAADGIVGGGDGNNLKADSFLAMLKPTDENSNAADTSNSSGVNNNNNNNSTSSDTRPVPGKLVRPAIFK